MPADMAALNPAEVDPGTPVALTVLRHLEEVARGVAKVPSADPPLAGAALGRRTVARAAQLRAEAVHGVAILKMAAPPRVEAARLSAPSGPRTDTSRGT